MGQLNKEDIIDILETCKNAYKELSKFQKALDVAIKCVEENYEESNESLKAR